MSINGDFSGGIDIVDESARRRKRSAIPSFSGDLDIDKLARGIPFESSENVNVQTQKNLISPFTTRAENLGQTNGRTKRKKINRRDKGRRSLVKESNRLKSGGRPRNVRQQNQFSFNDNSFSGLGV